MRQFDTFDSGKTSPDNYFGKANYFTDTPEDLENYTKEEGPDLNNRIDQLAEQIYNKRYSHSEEPKYGTEEYWTAQLQCKEMAKKKIIGEATPRTIPAYLKIHTPLILDKGGGTRFDHEYVYDKSGEDIVGERGTATKMKKAIERICRKYGINGDTVLGSVEEKLGYEWDGVTAYQVNEALRNTPQINEAENPRTGALIGMNVIRDIFIAAGFDGVIMNANQFFGEGVQGRKGMHGVAPQTRHYIVFRPEQIKAALGNQSFNPKDKSYLK